MRCCLAILFMMVAAVSHAGPRGSWQIDSLAANCKSWHPLEDIVTNFDRSGFGAEQTAYTGALISTPGLRDAGSSGTGQSFTNATWYIQTTDTTALQNLANSTAFTICAWVKQEAGANPGGISYIWTKGNGTTDLTFFSYNGQYTIYYYKTAVCELYARYTTDLRDGLWHFVVGVRNGSSFKLYIDAVDRTNAGVNGTTTFANTVTPHVGNRSNRDSAFIGRLDDIRVYNTALTAQQIQTLYITTRINP